MMALWRPSLTRIFTPSAAAKRSPRETSLHTDKKEAFDSTWVGGKCNSLGTCGVPYWVLLGLIGPLGLRFGVGMREA